MMRLADKQSYLPQRRGDTEKNLVMVYSAVGAIN